MELEPSLGTLYDKATALTLLANDVNKSEEEQKNLYLKAIAVYKRFLSKADPDNCQTAKSYYCIAQAIYLKNVSLKSFDSEQMKKGLLNKDVSNEMKKYFNLGLRAEKCRLPCFETVSETCLPKMLLTLLNVEVDQDYEIFEKCESCSYPKVFLRCSNCRKVGYCNRTCQKKNWNQHKKVCQNPRESEDTEQADQNAAPGPSEQEDSGKKMLEYVRIC
jgi:hypothetical protein